jgi:hypothetical protein
MPREFYRLYSISGNNIAKFISSQASSQHDIAAPVIEKSSSCTFYAYIVTRFICLCNTLRSDSNCDDLDQNFSALSIFGSRTSIRVGPSLRSKGPWRSAPIWAPSSRTRLRLSRSSTVPPLPSPSMPLARGDSARWCSDSLFRLSAGNANHLYLLPISSTVTGHLSLSPITSPFTVRPRPIFCDRKGSFRDHFEIDLPISTSSEAF